MNHMLYPTLWRTCRVLANPVRLRVLKTVMETPQVHVSAVQRLCRLPQSSTSQHLRLLQSRGLLTAKPTGRYLMYSPKTDPAVGNADRVLAVIRIALGENMPPAEIVTTLEGLKHSRRIAIVRALHHSPAQPEDLVRRCHISPPAVYRHLAKLSGLGFVEVDQEGLYKLANNTSPLTRELVRLVCVG